jgi:hypothetical protein
MNNTFNFKRFGFVFRKDMLENWKQYMYLFLTLFGIITIIFIWQSLDYYRLVKISGVSHRNINLELLTSASLMFAVFGIFFASKFMNPMSGKTKRIAYLTCPASNFEKALSRWVIVTLGYILSFFVALWIADVLRVGICATRYPEIEMKFLDLSKLFHTSDSPGTTGYFFDNAYIFVLVLNIYFLIQSLFILGSTFWEKASFVKTFIVVSAIILAFIFICRWAILLSYGSFDRFGNMLESFITVNEKEISQEQAATVAACVISVFTITNWTLAFCKLRESEIIKRL